MVPYENLNRLNKPFEKELQACFNAVLEEGQYILGSRLELFEHEFALYHSVKYCVGVSTD